jgi:hypothetical protein
MSPHKLATEEPNAKLPARAKAAAASPSPPSDGGEGRGEEGLFVQASPLLDPLPAPASQGEEAEATGFAIGSEVANRPTTPHHPAAEVTELVTDSSDDATDSSNNVTDSHDEAASSHDDAASSHDDASDSSDEASASSNNVTNSHDDASSSHDDAMDSSDDASSSHESVAVSVQRTACPHHLADALSLSTRADCKTRCLCFLSLRRRSGERREETLLSPALSSIGWRRGRSSRRLRPRREFCSRLTPFPALMPTRSCDRGGRASGSAGAGPVGTDRRACRPADAHFSPAESSRNTVCP